MIYALIPVYRGFFFEVYSRILFEDVVPIIITQMTKFPVLEKSRVGTVEWKLFQKMNQRANESFIRIDSSKNIRDLVMPTANRVLTLVVDGRHVLVEDSTILDLLISNILCHFSVSRKTFAGGPPASLLSNIQVIR